jgi:hypothetical protein
MVLYTSVFLSLASLGVLAVDSISVWYGNYPLMENISAHLLDTAT